MNADKKYVARHVDSNLFWADGIHVAHSCDATVYQGRCVPGIPGLIFVWSGEYGEWLDPVDNCPVYRSEEMVDDYSGAAKNLGLASSVVGVLDEQLAAAASYARSGFKKQALDAMQSARASLRYIQQRSDQARTQLEGPREK